MRQVRNKEYPTAAKSQVFFDRHKTHFGARARGGGVGGGGVHALGPNPAGWVFLASNLPCSTCNINIQNYCFARKFFLKADKLMLFLRKNQAKRTKPRQIMGTIRKKVMLIHLNLTLKFVILLPN
jgi:hypothetical protein